MALNPPGQNDCFKGIQQNAEDDHQTEDCDKCGHIESDFDVAQPHAGAGYSIVSQRFLKASFFEKLRLPEAADTTHAARPNREGTAFSRAVH
jgi:hypothetical protein